MKTIKTYGSDELIELCRNGKEEKVVQLMLQDRSLIKYIASLTKAKDIRKSILHDTILSFIRTCMKKDFEITTNPLSYIKGIARNYWLLELRKSNRQFVPLDSDSNLLFSTDTYLIDNDRKAVFEKLLNLISIDCREILKLWSFKYKMKEIADKLDFSSEGYAKKKKHLCLKKLISLVENDPKLKKEIRQYV